MKFRTEFIPSPSRIRLSPEHPVVMLGSCFSDNIAARMRNALWNAVNPCGTLYNPLSIASSVRAMLSEDYGKKNFKDSLFTDREGKIRSFYGDFRFAGVDTEEAEFKWLEAARSLINNLNQADALFITFGTSICYSLISDPAPNTNAKPHDEESSAGFDEENGLVRADILAATVANCHKLPSGQFRRFRLTIEEITREWMPLCRLLKKRFPNLAIVFTVSPVRHIKDGFTANARSKAILLLAIEEICRNLDFCEYFPAFEILNDDLRDYRFYASDLVHPSEGAVDYIWEIFKDTYLEDRARNLLREGEKIVKGYNHRPLLATAQERAAYENEMQRRYDDFCRLHPQALRNCFPAPR